MSEIVIVDYGAGNVQSVKFALQRLNVKAKLTSDIETIMKARKVIFPGVGEAKSAMDAIKETGLEKVLPNLKQDFLGICLGMQLMCTYSEERNTECLGIFSETVKYFEIDHKVPHMGWNKVEMKPSKLLEGIPQESSFYFVHSYYVPINDFTIGKTEYEIEFTAILEKENFYGCQFHPEKSSKHGAKIIDNFLKL